MLAVIGLPLPWNPTGLRSSGTGFRLRVFRAGRMLEHDTAVRQTRGDHEHLQFVGHRQTDGALWTEDRLWLARRLHTGEAGGPSLTARGPKRDGVIVLAFTYLTGPWIDMHLLSRRSDEIALVDRAAPRR